VQFTGLTVQSHSNKLTKVSDCLYLHTLKIAGTAHLQGQAVQSSDGVNIQKVGIKKSHSGKVSIQDSNKKSFTHHSKRHNMFSLLRYYKKEI
jgi:hypothetical protein